MKKLLFSLLALCCALGSRADGLNASIASAPSPAVSNKPLEVTITTDNMGSEVYCYTWCNKVAGEEKGISPWGWNDVHVEKFRMQDYAGTYRLTITSIKDFYGLTDAQLEGLTELGFIAKTAGGQQTQDLMVSVVQGRRDAYSGGEGTQADPFIIRTADDLMSLASTPGDWAAGTYFRLEANVEVPELRSTIGVQGTPFRASFDGNGHVISDYHFSNDKYGTPSGLFGLVDGGEVKNLGVINSTVYGSTYVAILVGRLESGLVERCYTDGRVGATSICAGGLVGENVSGTITDCYSGVMVENADDFATGGLVGKNGGAIANSYACGHVAGYDYVGGVVGANYGTVKNSFALNMMIYGRNDYVARFGGNNNSRNNATNTFSWEDMPAANAWTQHGHHADTKKATLLQTQEEFKSMSGWDFNNTWEWRKEGNKEYPVLKGLLGQYCQLPDEYFMGTTGVDDPAADGNPFLRVGPNPTQGELQILSSGEIALYELYSLSGTLTLQGAPATACATLDLSGLAEGLYILRTVMADGNEQVNKIIKK